VMSLSAEPGCTMSRRSLSSSGFPSTDPPAAPSGLLAAICIGSLRSLAGGGELDELCVLTRGR